MKGSAERLFLADSWRSASVDVFVVCANAVDWVDARYDQDPTDLRAGAPVTFLQVFHSTTSATRTAGREAFL